jgi:hypothetical protein
MNITIGSTVIRANEAPPNLATVLDIKGDTAYIEYEEGGTGYWPVDTLEIYNALPPPRWVEFVLSLATDVAVTQFIVGVSQVAPMLDRMLTVGLGQASQGDSQTFLAAWGTALASEMVPPQLITYLQTIAATYDLPPEFIAALSPPPIEE